MQCSKVEFEKSSKWIKRNARPLEAARWAYHFEGGSKEFVVQNLSAFQNEDGGFGNGIEPDFWLPLSSPMATWAAGQILLEINVDANEPIVQSIVKFLMTTFNPVTGMWASVLPEYNDYPHAPWWNWQEDVQNNWMFNPSAALAGYLVHWSSENSAGAQIGWASIEKAIAYLMSKDEMDKHEIQNFQQLIRIVEPFEDKFNATNQFTYEEVCHKVHQLAEQCMEKDETQWSTGYKPLPLDFIDSPNYPLYKNLVSLVDRNLQYYIKQMKDEGYWDITWGWGSYPEESPIARRQWQGILTINHYKLLKNFGLLEID
ncbi:hypothetical protein [Solibacillus sp. CAU 1738]|uniref:hypothetical protein n=1 Tax=Solibacillus sp. CAU 1738 TaxID=3140363 RepID=UPI0032618AB4